MNNFYTVTLQQAASSTLGIQGITKRFISKLIEIMTIDLVASSLVMRCSNFVFFCKVNVANQLICLKARNNLFTSVLSFSTVQLLDNKRCALFESMLG